jgi:hypothetical protein
MDMTSKYGLLTNMGVDIDPNESHRMVAVNAYYRAEKRGFEPGGEMDDWHAAELELSSRHRDLNRKTTIDGI